MNRRQFALNAGSLLGLSMGGVSAFPAHAVAPEVAAGARGLYRRALVLDGNLDLGDSLPLSQASLDTCGNSGLTVIKTTIGSVGQ